MLYKSLHAICIPSQVPLLIHFRTCCVRISAATKQKFPSMQEVGLFAEYLCKEVLNMSFPQRETHHCSASAYQHTQALLFSIPITDGAAATAAARQP